MKRTISLGAFVSVVSVAALLICVWWVLAQQTGASASLGAGGYRGPQAPAMMDTSAPSEVSPMAQAEATRKAEIAQMSPWKTTALANMEVAKNALPTVTPFDKFATQPPLPTMSPATFLQRNAGAGRLVEGLRNVNYIHSVGLVPTNLWIQKSANKYIVVYAGEQLNMALGGRSEMQGVVFVEWRSLDTPGLSPVAGVLPGGGVFPTPSRNGPIMIVDSVGQQLILRAIDGTSYVFDVRSQQYVSSPLGVSMLRSVAVGTITEKGDMPMDKPGFRPWNQWSNATGNGRLSLFAGVEGGNGREFGVGTGKLVLVASQGQPTAADTPQVYSPQDTAHGPLRVFDVTNNQVILVDGFGKAFVFDLASHLFLPCSEMKLPKGLLFDNHPSTSSGTLVPIVLPSTPSALLAPTAYP